MRKRAEGREERETTTQKINFPTVVPLLFLARTCTETQLTRMTTTRRLCSN